MRKKNNDFIEKIKEFFRLTKAKLIITISIMLGLFVIFLVTQSYAFGQTIARYVYYLPLKLSLPFTYEGTDAIAPTLISGTIFLLTFILQFYVISCLVVLIYNKLRK